MKANNGYTCCGLHVVEMINKFASEDKYILCADGQV
jgi:hypothetical protein